MLCIHNVCLLHIVASAGIQTYESHAHESARKVSPKPVLFTRSAGLNVLCQRVCRNTTPSSFGSPYRLLYTREKDYVEINFILERAILH